MKIVINDIPPSNNTYMGNSRSYHLYNEKKKEWHWKIKAAIKNRPKEPYQKAEVKIKYFFKTRQRRDPDNYSGKFILDPLVREGVLKDDSFDNVALRLEGGYDKDNPRTEIIVTENGGQ